MNKTELNLLEKLFDEKVHSTNKAIRASGKGIRIYVDAGFEAQNNKLNSIIEINKNQNHAIAKNAKEIADLQSNMKPVITVRSWSKKKKFWFILVACSFLFLAIGEILYHVVGLRIFANLIKNFLQL